MPHAREIFQRKTQQREKANLQLKPWLGVAKSEDGRIIDTSKKVNVLNDEKRLKNKLRTAAYCGSGLDLGALFRHYDRDNSGSLDFKEFRYIGAPPQVAGVCVDS